MRKEFGAYYSEIYGDRWPRIFAALLSDANMLQWKNPWYEGAYSVQTDELWPNYHLSDFSKSSPHRGENGLLNTYILDAASAYVSQLLPLKGAKKILDMCAAPGGKSLGLIQQMDLDAEIICNEISSSRRAVLTKVIRQYVPENIRQRVWVKGLDASIYGLKFKNSFDAILLDAPCSGERHLLASSKVKNNIDPNTLFLENWSLKGTQRLSARQFSLLSSAYLALKPGGFLLYSTCSINPLENEMNIAKLLDRKEKSLSVNELATPEQVEVAINLGSSKNQYSSLGYYILPDKTNGMGPMYFCLLKK